MSKSTASSAYTSANSAAQAAQAAAKASAASAATAKASNAASMAYMYANEARMTGSGVAATKAAQAASQAYSYANEARMSSSSISGYGSASSAYTGYYNSSYSTGKIPSTDAPRIKDVTEQQAYYCNAATAASTISSITSFVYGLVQTINSSLSKEEASRLATEAVNWVKNGFFGSHVISNLEAAAKLNSIANKAAALSGAATIVGTIVDFAFQLKTNESTSVAVAKTGSHLLLGLAGGTAAAALVTFSPIVAIVAGTAVSLLGSDFIDYGIDYINKNTSFFEEIDNEFSEWKSQVSSFFGKKD